MIRIERIGAEYPNVELYAKAEWFNPGGSVKDRAAYSMIRDGEKRGALRPGKIILDATSGNTGIAYAMVGAALGIPGEVVLADERIAGAEADSGALTAWRLFTRRAMRVPTARFAVCGKFTRPSRRNIFIRISTTIPRIRAAHYNGTGPEIWAQTQGRVTHFVAGLGTSGTFVGTTRRLKELNPAIRCISVQPDSEFSRA